MPPRVFPFDAFATISLIAAGPWFGSIVFAARSGLVAQSRSAQVDREALAPGQQPMAPSLLDQARLNNADTLGVLFVRYMELSVASIQRVPAQRPAAQLREFPAEFRPQAASVQVLAPPQRLLLRQSRSVVAGPVVEIAEPYCV